MTELGPRPPFSGDHQEPEEEEPTLKAKIQIIKLLQTQRKALEIALALQKDGATEAADLVQKLGHKAGELAQEIEQGRVMEDSEVVEFMLDLKTALEQALPEKLYGFSIN